jgi:hypothetical protein
MRAWILLLALAGAACAGGRHRRGDRQAVFSGSFGEPMSGNSLGFTGHGDARNVGLAAGNQWFMLDRWAVGVQAAARYYDQAGGAAFALEIEGTARHYLFELGRVGVVFDFTGGNQVSTRDIPPGGTSLNWVFGFGPTLEIPLGEETDLLAGYQWRHLSNGRGGDSPDNPTQNDHRLWVGVTIDW